LWHDSNHKMKLKIEKMGKEEVDSLMCEEL
jgi:hypothetical protein